MAPSSDPNFSCAPEWDDVWLTPWTGINPVWINAPAEKGVQKVPKPPNRTDMGLENGWMDGSLKLMNKA